MKAMSQVRGVIVAGALLGISTTVLSQPSPDPRATFKVGTAVAGRGQKVTGVIAVPAGVDAATSIAVAVVHGARPGPVLAIVAGAHGTEYSSILAVERLIQVLDPAQISGTVIL
ncbi:MAG: succinylglutamate desuccinylase/aspartoacylase family protein, partial [Acidobacteria bacterium]|nr:succinylglutamate desuccinylase/aspartoacylase family protein [Acidobacteriota bacterium]